MKILPYKRIKVADGLTVWVSNHYRYTDFGIRDSGEMRYTGRRYVEGNEPGSGFIERESESHSYRQFVRKCLAEQKTSYWKLLLGKEPDFDKVLEEANTALLNATDPRKRELLECYVNALTVARKEERMERVVRAIKNKMGHKSNKFMVSVISHYKSKIRQLEHDMESVEWNVKDHYSPETYEAYAEAVHAFTKVASCRRIWLLDTQKRNQYVQVFFDLGVFDYIRSESYIPLMRDNKGREMYLLPDAMIVARSAVDFDILPLKTLTIVCQELAIEEPTEDMLSSIGDAASMIKIPELNLNYYFNHVHSVVDFVRAVDKLKYTL
jgi:hypothetical protein